MSPRIEHLSDSVTLYLGDCREILPTLGKVDAVVTDPPYGIGIAANPVRQKHEKMAWDNKPASGDLIALAATTAPTAIIWGGNYFDLPPSQCFLVWDKVQPENFSLAMCEVAWTSMAKPAKMFKRHVVSFAKNHPTQKPLELMEWCLLQLPPPCDSDPRSLHGLRHNRSGGSLARPQVHRHRDRAQIFRHRLPPHQRRVETTTPPIGRASRSHRTAGT